ncbi:capsule biosynthesis protein CapF [Deinococcus sp. RL]|uniref:polysaccharide biosynthesis C-terminal domain-containing protein n=1 Tax=Deinococcus sp. RL TaxID=1489678 RepID=UPI0004D4FBD0|nr:NAD-dependent epimerase/dehydratase family protein [Deinococcus sp. RL]KEF34224.1 capsule biosynthesis protein CapF [Deinococcus sp. RL]
MRVAVTGAHGMLGTHLRAYLRAYDDVQVVPIGREEFAGDLAGQLAGCEVVFHLAGMNRGDEREVARTNVALTERLVGALEEAGSRAHVLFSSSTHIERDTLYGESKRRAAELLEAWAARSGGRFSNVVLPGVFGEGGKPFYNSVVATFCHQLARGEEPTANDSEIEQIHAQEVARRLWRMVGEEETGTVRVEGRKLTVRELLETLQEMRDTYAGHVIPDISDPFRRDLFNMYRSYLYPAHYPVPLTLHSDPRGTLFEAIKTPSGGQAFMSTTHPGVTRGNHFHTRKVERFLVSGGEAEIRLRHIFGTEVQTYRVSGEQPSYVDIPTLHTHNITNVGETTLLTLFWTNELFDPANPDQVPEPVEPQ